MLGMIPGWLWIVMISGFFATAFGVGQGFYWSYVSRKNAEREKLARRLGASVSEAEHQSLFRDLNADAMARNLGGLGQHLQDILVEAEVNWTVGQLVLYSSLISGGLGLGLFLFIGPASILVGLLGGLVPYFVVRQRAEARSRKLLEQLPEALDLMARSLQAGLGLSDAFKMCAEELPLPLAGEFGRVFEEVRFGRDYRTALMSLLDRNPRLFELRMFVSSVLLQRETGGNLIEVLNSISNTIRNRFLFHAKVKALTSEARFSALILGCLPFAVFLLLFFVRPEYLKPLWTDTWGMYMIGAILLLYTVGGYLMYSISQVEV